MGLYIFQIKTVKYCLIDRKNLKKMFDLRVAIVYNKPCLKTKRFRKNI